MPMMEETVPIVQRRQQEIAPYIAERRSSLIRPFEAVDNPSPASTHIAQVLRP